VTSQPLLAWNPDLQVVVSDLDETLAGLYLPAAPELVVELAELLRGGLVLVLATGQGITSTWERLVALLPPVVRRRVIAGCCSGAELWAFDDEGLAYPLDRPSPLDDGLHRLWRQLVGQVLAEFGLTAHPTGDVASFQEATAGDGGAVMLADRRSQITLEMANTVAVREQVVDRANDLFSEHQLPVEARAAATFAVDFVIEGVTKAAVVDALREDPRPLAELGVDPAWATTAQLVEVWGDSFTPDRGAIDLRISQRLHPGARSISFRDLDPVAAGPVCNVVAWPGRHRLQAGVLEYLLSRHHREMTTCSG
jgi:hydroxymethylpyrimidine pyrophosphatase-like HAD family hydrolase